MHMKSVDIIGRLFIGIVDGATSYSERLAENNVGQRGTYLL